MFMLTLTLGLLNFPKSAEKKRCCFWDKQKKYGDILKINERKIPEQLSKTNVILRTYKN